MNYNFKTIGTIRSCYKEKFGIPRQPGLVSSIATIEIATEYSQNDAFRELETFSHIWVFFVFHAVETNNWKSTVRPPRLGGNQRVGVFASRSMFRPNPIGLSVVELKSVERIDNKIVLTIMGGDFLDATPIIDIKPYLPYVDSVDAAIPGYAVEKPDAKFNVVFTEDARAELEKANKEHPMLSRIITEILMLDPRPAYHEKKQIKKEFAIKLYDYDLKWHVNDNEIIVTALTLLD